MSEDGEEFRPLSPEDPVSPSYSHHSSPHSNGRNAPESPTGDSADIYKDEDAEPAPASPVQSKSPSPVRSTTKVAIESDESDGEGTSDKRALIDSDASDVETKKKKKFTFDDDSDDEDVEKKEPTGKQLFGSDSDDDDDAPKKTNTEDLDEARSDSDDDDGPRDRHSRTFEWDFDKMLAEKKAERKRKTRRGKDGGIDIINDDDGLVVRLTERMKAAAKSDRNANVERKPAFQKIKMLPEVKAMLLRAGIVDALIENGFMSALSEWLAPLPDKCLPALDIRITILKLLHNPRFWKLDRSTLKQSGLGKAVMMLYKHPNETKENKAIANKLIGEWARPIYHLDADYSTISRDERKERDYARVPEKRRHILNSQDDDEELSGDQKKPRIKESEWLDPTKSGELKPGDKGYINRARVPKPSTKDYVVRPEWKVHGKFGGEKKERTKKSKANRIVKVSLEGRNMGI
ncbi:unnamed protein product [Caenorhabditis sp. 36 PRJEB53466]|nr:unnamed protein product [Caenorhabditis sp. 36 PRJEB53466]